MLDLTHYNLPSAGGYAHDRHPLAHKVFTGHHGKNGGMHIRDINNPVHVAEDEELLKRGLIDAHSLMAAYTEQIDPMRVLVHNPDGTIKAVRYSHNLRINYGGQMLMKQLLSADNVAAGTGPNLYLCTQATIAYGASAPWTVTPSTSPAWVAHAYQDHFLVTLNSVAKFGTIQDNTATAATVDQWNAPTAGTVTNPISATGAASTAPAANSPFMILHGAAPLLWVALTNTASFTPNTTDASLTGEVVGNGLSRQFLLPSVTTNPTGSGAVNQTAACKLHGVWTASGTVTAIQGAGAFNCANNSGAGQPANEGTFTAFGTNSGDSVTLDWTWTNS